MLHCISLDFQMCLQCALLSYQYRTWLGTTLKYVLQSILIQTSNETHAQG